MTWPTSIITTGLIKYIVVVVGIIIKGIININYEAIMEVFIEVHFKVIAKKSAIFVKNQIAGQLSTFLISERKHITSFTKMQKMSEIIKLLQPTSKAFDLI